MIACDGEEFLTQSLTKTLTRFDIPFTFHDISTQEGIQSVLDFYEDQVKDGETEGIVVKPDTWIETLPPALKVRNSEYLRLVYGYNYLSYLEKHTREKDIRGKLYLSIREQALNLHLLKAHLSGNLNDKIEIYKLLIVEFSKEEGLDPRL